MLERQSCENYTKAFIKCCFILYKKKILFLCSSFCGHWKRDGAEQEQGVLHILPQRPSDQYVSVTGFNYLFICLSVRLCRDASPHPLDSAATSKVRRGRCDPAVQMVGVGGGGGGGSWRRSENKQGLAQGQTPQTSFSRRPFLEVTISHTLLCLPGRRGGHCVL